MFHIREFEIIKQASTLETLNLNKMNLNDEQFYEQISSRPGLKVLYCESNNITNLDHLPDSLQAIFCYDNKIKNMDHLPPNLKVLSCQHNQITSLDHLPEGLKILDCGDNQIKNLDYLPYHLEILQCHCNDITRLDYLPFTLQELYCYNNQIINLEYLPNSLRKLISDGTQKSKKYRLNDKSLMKRARYLRFLRNQQKNRKTKAFMILKEIQSQSEFNKLCLPIEVIKHIVNFV